MWKSWDSWFSHKSHDPWCLFSFFLKRIIYKEFWVIKILLISLKSYNKLKQVNGVWGFLEIVISRVYFTVSLTNFPLTSIVVMAGAKLSTAFLRMLATYLCVDQSFRMRALTAIASSRSCSVAEWGMTKRTDIVKTHTQRWNNLTAI